MYSLVMGKKSNTQNFLPSTPPPPRYKTIRIWGGNAQYIEQSICNKFQNWNEMSS